jgi:cytochrome c556
MAADDKNPYDPDTPEWQLWENMRGAERSERAYIADADRYTKMAAAQRQKAAAFKTALGKLKSSK